MTQTTMVQTHLCSSLVTDSQAGAGLFQVSRSYQVPFLMPMAKYNLGNYIARLLAFIAK